MNPMHPHWRPPQHFLPEPHPPVSMPAEQQPRGAVGNTGPIYGTQRSKTWQPGERNTPAAMLDLLKTEYLWRISVFGNVLVSVTYGTQATRQIALLRTPLIMTLPGQVTVTVQALDQTGTECTATATMASAGARAIARQLISADAGAVAVNEDAVDFFALVNSTLNVSSVAVVVPALSVVPLVAGSVLTSGSGLVEYEA